MTSVFCVLVMSFCVCCLDGGVGCWGRRGGLGGREVVVEVVMGRGERMVTNSELSGSYFVYTGIY